MLPRSGCWIKIEQKFFQLGGFDIAICHATATPTVASIKLAPLASALRWRFGGDAARLALDSGSGADSCDAARLVCRDVSIVSNARENNTREQNLSQSLKQKQMLRVAQLLVPTYPKCANHDNLNGCQCLMFFAPLNNLWSHQ